MTHPVHRRMVGPWIKLRAFQNPYDQIGTENFFGCMYDPIDDGTNEDDYFEPADPERRLGPSSTCKPAGVFANLGETSDAFAPENVGRADGPGLQGVWGIGTWVESRFDLGRFRGRRVHIRFVATSLKYPPNPDDWELFFPGLNPHPGDDGWWIDDVTVDGALTAAASVTIDSADNSSLPGPPRRRRGQRRTLRRLRQLRGRRQSGPGRRGSRRGGRRLRYVSGAPLRRRSRPRRPVCRAGQLSLRFQPWTGQRRLRSRGSGLRLRRHRSRNLSGSTRSQRRRRQQLRGATPGSALRTRPRTSPGSTTRATGTSTPGRPKPELRATRSYEAIPSTTRSDAPCSDRSPRRST